MNGDPKFTLYWRTGQREVVQGRDCEEAMALAGYGGGAVRALDFWTNGDNHAYVYDPKTREWNSRRDGIRAMTSGDRRD